jgi:hypothetical protein
VTADDIAQTRRSVRELTKAGEREIHEVVLSCTRAPAPIIERRADYETDPPLTLAAGGGRSFVRGFPANGWIKWV